jgi:hypothetical protein
MHCPYGILSCIPSGRNNLLSIRKTTGVSDVSQYCGKVSEVDRARHRFP